MRSETSDGFGLALAVGNFNGDAYDDLAVGAPGDFGGSNTGSVTVLNGGAGGLMPFDGYLIHQDQPGIFDSAEAGDLFGHALATGDFDGNGFDDLAIGVPGEDGVGAVQVIFGSAFGLIFTENLIWRETNIGGASAAGDRFGNTLAAGDFDGDGHADLAIGVPWKNLGPGGAIGDTGVVFVIFGSQFRFDLRGRSTSTQGGLVGHDESGDLFGFGLETGDFDADGLDDLVIAAPFEDLATFDSGQVSILMGVRVGTLDDPPRDLLPRPVRHSRLALDGLHVRARARLRRLRWRRPRRPRHRGAQRFRLAARRRRHRDGALRRALRGRFRRPDARPLVEAGWTP